MLEGILGCNHICDNTQIQIIGEEMIHWAFLIPTFIAGFAAGYAFIYQMAKIAAKVEAVIEEASRYAI